MGMGLGVMIGMIGMFGCVCDGYCEMRQDFEVLVLRSSYTVQTNSELNYPTPTHTPKVSRSQSLNSPQPPSRYSHLSSFPHLSAPPTPQQQRRPPANYKPPIPRGLSSMVVILPADTTYRGTTFPSHPNPHTTGVISPPNELH